MRTSNSGLPAKVSFRENEGENRKQPKERRKELASQMLKGTPSVEFKQNPQELN